MRRPYLFQTTQTHCLKPLHHPLIFLRMQRTGHIDKTAARQQTLRKRKRNTVLHLRKMSYPLCMPPDIRPTGKHPQAAARHIRQNVPPPLPHGRPPGIRQSQWRYHEVKPLKMLGKLPQPQP